MQLSFHYIIYFNLLLYYSRYNMSVIIVIIVFLLLVVIHELGHFFAAKRSWVHVKEFGIGIPPKLFRLRKDKAWTEYTINAIPLGWFVRLKGENPHNTEDFYAKNSFTKARFVNKILILLWGIIMNILAARLCFAIVFIGESQPLTIIPDAWSTFQSQSFLFPSESFALQQWILQENQEEWVIIHGINAGWLADKAGLQKNDQIISINSVPVTWENIATALSGTQQKDFSLSRKTQEATTETTTIACEDDPCLLGIYGQGKYTVLPYNNSLGEALTMAWKEVIAETKLTFNMLGTLIANLFSRDKEKIQESVDQLSGPIGATKIGSEMIAVGWREYLLIFAAMISLALAVFNILPIPALDGGRIVSTIIQTVWRIPLDKFAKVEGYVNLFFFILLMAMWILIMIKDYQQFWT